MPAFESYFFLFCDSFFSALILPPRDEMAVKLLTIFGNHNNYFIFSLAFLGSVGGSLVNYLIGKYFLFLRKSDFFINKEKEIANAENKWNKYFIYLLLVSWISAIGNPFAVLCGFFRSNIYKFLSLVIISKFYYYFLLVFFDFDLKV
ncbi:MAG: DedA family protein [Pelagibacterales bacterium]|nr:DedA family protein [Pelagibacterales bacterium]